MTLCHYCLSALSQWFLSGVLGPQQTSVRKLQVVPLKNGSNLSTLWYHLLVTQSPLVCLFENWFHALPIVKRLKKKHTAREDLILPNVGPLSKLCRLGVLDMKNFKGTVLNKLVTLNSIRSFYLTCDVNLCISFLCVSVLMLNSCCLNIMVYSD